MNRVPRRKIVTARQQSFTYRKMRRNRLCIPTIVPVAALSKEFSKFAEIGHNFRAPPGFVQTRATPLPPADIATQFAHRSNGGCATSGA